MDCNNPFPSKSDLAVLRNHASSSSPQDRDHTSSTHLDRASPSPPNLDLAPTSNQTPYSDRLNKMMTENSFPLSNRSDPFFEDVAEHLSRLDAGLHWKKLNNDRGSAQPTGPNGVFRPSVDIASHDLRSFGPPDTHMVLMACDSNELCRETQKGGFFTTALLKVLKANKNLTYAQIMDRMDDIPHQTPQLEGYHRDRRIFDFEDLPAPSVDR
ncbi:hypothetical protein HYPSUDRAFT_1041009 [Hypholoma sublateritium FD-334 SS-4]|uniref:Uncharacterized protein n=1 Tax=Hypholoma sublateritium (strain FD-334 SS-4) TaxID=945553 RepID=A0A0D2PA66_HYPSF|nr:hypothetical protein HYPSUDRAFT_1041009 [Hypholoma sublateritium FD-334 SS-4]